MKFALNASSDTLRKLHTTPTWHGGAFQMYVRFVMQDKPYTHILNHYKKALDLRRFNTRHDQVLKIIADFTRKLVPDDMQVVVDLEDQFTVQFTVDLVTILEVGARGFIKYESFCRLNEVLGAG